MSDEGTKDHLPVDFSEPITRAPEDEFVESISNIAVNGKFPQGLDLEGKELVKPQEWWIDFTTFSLTGWNPSRSYSSSHYKMIEILDPASQEKPFPNSGIIMILPDPQSAEHSIIAFSFFQNSKVRDSAGRGARTATIFFQMTIDKARQFIKLVKETPNGADIAESFIQKGAPNVLAKSEEEKGIWRKETKDLFIFDEDFQRDYLGNNLGQTDFMQQRVVRKTLQNNPQDVFRKVYTTPVGFGQ